MIITQKNLHLFIVFEVALFNLLIAPLSLNKIKVLYSDNNMLGSYLIIIGAIFLAGNGFKKYIKPSIEKYYSKNKKMKLFCEFANINCDTKKIFELKKPDCFSYVFCYSILILFFYPILFLINQMIICTISLYKAIKPKILSYVR
jgi:hypothetical protein